MSHVISGGRAVRMPRSAISQLREGLTDVSRTIEDLTWTNLSQDIRTLGLDDDWVKRRDLLSRLRTIRKRSPLAKQAFQLLKNYTLGQGVTLRPNNKQMVAKIIDEFWDNPVNQATFTSYESMVQALDSLFTDGDLFLVLFPDEELGTVEMTWIDSILVQDIITDTENWRLAKWYKVRRTSSKYDFKSGAFELGSDTDDFVYYRDWRNNDTVEPVKTGSRTKYDPDQPRPSQIAEGYIYHVAINKRGKFGESELAAAADWLKAHKDFMEDRATLSRAAAQIAWRKKRKGNATDVNQQLNALRSSLVENLGRWETNPPSASGSTIVENEGSTMEWVKTDTGAQNALMDERILRMMVGSSLGVMNHYFGDEASSNLATATAMELPMLKMYEGWQKLLADVVKNLCLYALTVAHKAGRIGEKDVSLKYKKDTSQTPSLMQALGVVPTTSTVREALVDRFGYPVEFAEAAPLSVVTMQQPPAVDANEEDSSGAVDWYVDVDFPPIVQRDVSTYIAALKNLFSMMPVLNVESQKLVVSMALTVMGVNDTDEVMAKLFSGDFSQATFAVIPIQSTGATAPGTLMPGTGQAGMPGAQPGVPKQPGNVGSPNQPVQLPASSGVVK